MANSLKSQKEAASVEKYSLSERPFHYPLPVSRIIQPILRQALLALARYSVSFPRPLPEEPGILAAVPHSEHADHILFPPEKVGIVAAKDYWFRSVLLQVVKELIVDSVPIERKRPTKTDMAEAVFWQRELLEKRKKHVLLYPQGTRYGRPDSEEQLEKQMKNGVARFARELQVPVYPVAIRHAEHYAPSKKTMSADKRILQHLKSGRIPPRMPIEVVVGDALRYPEYPEEDTQFLAVLAQASWSLLNSEN